MDNKIIKYKLKKNKMENKIYNILHKKKKEYNDTILRSIVKMDFVCEIIDNIIKLNNNNKIQDQDQDEISLSKKEIIIITGIYGVGKSTMINHLENFFGESNIKSKINIKNIDEINIINNILSNLTNNSSNPYQLVMIECGLELVKNVYEKITNILNQIENWKIHIIHIIPKNDPSYKNKLINKIFNSIGQNSKEFELNIHNMIKNIYPIDNIDFYINLNIDLIIKSSILSDNDFIILDQLIGKFIAHAGNWEFDNPNPEIKLITTKFYL